MNIHLFTMMTMTNQNNHWSPSTSKRNKKKSAIIIKRIPTTYKTMIKNTPNFATKSEDKSNNQNKDKKL